MLQKYVLFITEKYACVLTDYNHAMYILLFIQTDCRHLRFPKNFSRKSVRE